MLITRPCYEAVGPFNELYPMGMEDVEYCLEALERGLEIGLATNATGLHLLGATSGHMDVKRAESAALFYPRWPLERVAALIRQRMGVLHPLRCGCPKFHPTDS